VKIRTLLAIFFTIGLFSVALAAENDLASKLVGKWEGAAATKTNTRRRLVVESVRRDGDQWVGAGRFGSADRDVNPKIDIKITASGNDVALEFLTSENNPVQLKLLSDNEMAGSIRVVVQKGRMADADLKLKKVE
jgi:hypothetical protein